MVVGGGGGRWCTLDACARTGRLDAQHASPLKSRLEEVNRRGVKSGNPLQPFAEMRARIESFPSEGEGIHSVLTSGKSGLMVKADLKKCKC